MYKAFWSNVTRAEEAAWKMIAAYTALFAGLSIATPTIGIMGFLSVIIVFSFMAIGISLNANLWFVRNIGLISNLEMDFLKHEDYGVLIPLSYQEKLEFVSRKTFEVWWIMIVAFLSVCILTLVALFPKLCATFDKLLILAIFFGSLLLTCVYGQSLKKRYDRFKEAAPGRPPTPS